VTGNLAVATLAGGCFWCLEAVFADLEGVVSVQPGYTGGHVENPAYEQVCRGDTGHAEAVQIHFDPQVISYRELLEIFFAVHDPTTLNRQGPDVGTQYRSAIFYHDEAQRALATALIAELTAQGIWERPIVTEVTRFERFYPAEEYHRQYFARHPEQPYCQAVIAPKLARFRQRFGERLKSADRGR
jgi:peptide-methionine (S)-S-oxide reductase